MKHEDIRFGTIRKYCSRLDRISICMLETHQYENYQSIKDVPVGYDGFFLYGFGMINSEFPDEEGPGIRLKKCIEIMLSREPRNIQEECI